MKRAIIGLLAVGMIAGAQSVKAETLAQEVPTEVGGIFSSQSDRKKGKYLKKFNTVKSTKKYWNRNARKLRNRK